MKKALFICGGWAGHEPFQTAEIIIQKMQESGVECDLQDNQECLLAEDLQKKYDLIVPVWTMGEISREASLALRNAVLAGTALGGWHGGMCDALRKDTEYQFMCGGQWVAHPGGVIPYRVNITGGNDPITSGIEDFDIISEQYYMHTDPGNRVLATTTFRGDHAFWIDGTVMPVIWTRTYGKGNVFYCSLGHGADDFRHYPQIPEMIRRGFLWSIGEL